MQKSVKQAAMPWPLLKDVGSTALRSLGLGSAGYIGGQTIHSPALREGLGQIPYVGDKLKEYTRNLSNSTPDSLALGAAGAGLGLGGRALKGVSTSRIGKGLAHGVESLADRTGKGLLYASPAGPIAYATLGQGIDQRGYDRGAHDTELRLSHQNPANAQVGTSPPTIPGGWQDKNLDPAGPELSSNVNNVIPNWGKGLTLGAGALGAGYLANKLTEEEDEQGRVKSKAPWLGPLVGGGAAALGAYHMIGKNPSLATDPNFWASSKSATYIPLIHVPHLIKLSIELPIKKPLVPPIDQTSVPGAPQSQAPQTQPIPTPTPAPPTSSPNPAMPKTNPAMPKPSPNASTQLAINSPSAQTAPAKVTPQPSTQAPPPTQDNSRGPLSDIRTMASPLKSLIPEDSGPMGAFMRKALTIKPDAASPEVGIANVVKEMQAKSPGASVSSLWEMAKDYWTKLPFEKKVMVGLGLGLGAYGLMQTMMGQGGMTGPLLGIGGLGLAAHGAGAFDKSTPLGGYLHGKMPSWAGGPQAPAAPETPAPIQMDAQQKKTTGEVASTGNPTNQANKPELGTPGDYAKGVALGMPTLWNAARHPVNSLTSMYNTLKTPVTNLGKPLVTGAKSIAGAVPKALGVNVGIDAAMHAPEAIGNLTGNTDMESYENRQNYINDLSKQPAYRRAIEGVRNPIDVTTGAGGHLIESGGIDNAAQQQASQLDKARNQQMESPDSYYSKLHNAHKYWLSQGSPTDRPVIDPTGFEYNLGAYNDYQKLLEERLAKYPSAARTQAMQLENRRMKPFYNNPALRTTPQHNALYNKYLQELEAARQPRREPQVMY